MDYFYPFKILYLFITKRRDYKLKYEIWKNKPPIEGRITNSYKVKDSLKLSDL